MKTYKGSYALIAAAMLLSSAVFAQEPGPGEGTAEQGQDAAVAVGQAVLAAAQAVYSENTDPEVIKAKLIEILNEVVATGNEQSVRYAIVAIMMAGGGDNMDLAISAVNSSSAFAAFGSVVSDTVSQTVTLLVAQGAPGGGTGGAGSPTQPASDLFGPGSAGERPGDFPATPI